MKSHPSFGFVSVLASGLLVALGLSYLMGSFLSRSIDPRAELVRFRLTSNSMAPAMFGPHFPAACQECQMNWKIASETFQADWPLNCPACSSTHCELGTLQAGQVVSFARSAPLDNSKTCRLDCIAFRGESEALPASPWICKRVWGLPGESIELRAGELWVDGQQFRKSFEQFQSVAIEVHQVGTVLGSRTLVQGNAPESISTIALDDYAMDHATPRNLVEVDDLMLEIEFDESEWSNPEIPSQVIIECTYQGRQCEVACLFGDQIGQGGYPPNLAFAENPKRMTLGGFDGTMWLQWDDKQAAQVCPRSLNSDPSMATSFSLRAVQGCVAIKRMRQWRDIYLRSSQRDSANGIEQPTVVAAGEYFVLGDNLPISRDSRNGLGNISSARVVGRVE